jgi:hypothetical protein
MHGEVLSCIAHAKEARARAENAIGNRRGTFAFFQRDTLATVFGMF